MVYFLLSDASFHLQSWPMDGSTGHTLNLLFYFRLQMAVLLEILHGDSVFMTGNFTTIGDGNGRPIIKCNMRLSLYNCLFPHY